MQSYANAIVSSAEDPEKLLDQTVLEMNEDLIKMRQASAQVFFFFFFFPYTVHVLGALGLRIDDRGSRYRFHAIEILVYI
jgi:hypothetical protein